MPVLERPKNNETTSETPRETEAYWETSSEEILEAAKAMGYFREEVGKETWQTVSIPSAKTQPIDLPQVPTAVPDESAAIQNILDWVQERYGSGEFITDYPIRSEGKGIVTDVILVEALTLHAPLLGSDVLKNLLHRWVELTLHTALEEARQLQNEASPDFVAFTSVCCTNLLPEGNTCTQLAEEAGVPEQQASLFLSVLRSVVNQFKDTPWQSLGWVVPADESRTVVFLWDHYLPFMRHANAWKEAIPAEILSSKGNTFRILINWPDKDLQEVTYQANEVEAELLRYSAWGRYFEVNNTWRLLPEALVSPYVEERRAGWNYYDELAGANDLLSVG